MVRLWKRIPILILLVDLAKGGPVSEADESDHSSPRRRLSSRSFVKCTGHGLMPSEATCRSFYYCLDLSGEGLHWVAFRFNCPRGMVFHSEARECISLLEYTDLDFSTCRVRKDTLRIRKEVTLTYSNIPETQNALVIVSGFKTDDCENILQRESGFITSVSGYRRDVELVLEEMPKVCSSIVSAYEYSEKIKSRQLLPLPTNDTIIYKNISISYNEDLKLLQSLVDYWTEDGGVLRSLDNVLKWVKNFEADFVMKLSEISENVSLDQPSRLQTVNEEDRLDELTKHVEVCLNFSTYNSSPEAMMTFVVSELGEKQDNVGNALIDIQSQPEAFFEYVQNYSESVLNETRTLQMILSDYLEFLWSSYGKIRTHLVTAVSSIRNFQQELEESYRQKAMDEKLKYRISRELDRKLSLRTKIVSSPGVLSFINSLWKKGSDNKNLVNYVDSRYSSGYIRNFEYQVINMRSMLNTLSLRISVKETDIPILEKEIMLFERLNFESKILLDDFYWFVSDVVRTKGFVTEIENIFQKVANEAQEDIFRAIFLKSTAHTPVMKLHMRMAFENLKWNWRYAGGKLTTLRGC